MDTILSILLCILLYLVSCERYEPTHQEILKARAFQSPLNSWGRQARQERELRLYAIGGSNTRKAHYSDPILENFANSSLHPSWHGIFHRKGIPGVYDSDVIGRRFEFENWEHSRWPNVIMLEFSANIIKWNNVTVTENAEAIVLSLRMKYSVLHIPEPDFMFLELFNVDQLIIGMSPSARLDHKRSVMEAQLSDQKYLALRRVASFYDFPTVSWRELALNAFIRYYLASNDSFSEVPWEYTDDGVHISAAGGVLLYDTLLGPFFHQAMAPRNETKWDEHHPTSATAFHHRMFPPSNRSFELTRGVNLTQIIRQPSRWLSSSFHNQNVVCSRDKAARLILDVVIPLECDHVDTCSMSVGFLHSWNKTNSGTLDCELHSAASNQLVDRVVVDTTQDAYGHQMSHTAGVRTEIRVPRSGNYSFSCNKLDDKLTCLTSFAARSIMEV